MKRINYNFWTICLLFFSVLILNAQINSYPYTEDFESGAGGWTVANGVTTSWELGVPTGTIINSAASGNNAWVTNLSGSYLVNENGWIESPVFDLSSLINPIIELAIWWQCEFSWDGAVLQSSIDSGVSWQNVGAYGDANNWYTDNTIFATPGGQLSGWSGRVLTGNGSNGWVTASHELSSLIGQSNVIFRIVFASEGSVNDEGIGIDLIKIKEAVLGIDYINKLGIRIYPNPVKDVLNIKLNNGLNLKGVNLYNMQGQYLFSSKTEKVNIKDLITGIYFIEIETNKGKIVKKIFVE